jgi:NAD(P)-dependent dehydrogenase (short-subunit alcohol dehydrogenase family)
MKIKDSVVLITGAARRVGKVIALDMACRGAKVIVHYHRSKKEAKELASLVRRKGVGEIHLLQGDLAKISEVQRLAKEAWAWQGRVDALIHNASSFYPTPLGKVTERQWEDLFATNAKAPFFLSQALGEKMFRRGRGKIVCLGDWAAHHPYSNFLPYCAAKAALLALSKGLARSLAPKVQVNAVLPGPVMWPQDLDAKAKKKILQKTPLKRAGSPEDVASAVRFFIEGNDFMTGSELHVDGGRHIV